MSLSPEGTVSRRNEGGRCGQKRQNTIVVMSQQEARERFCFNWRLV
jgi:hypothetical protein